MIENLIAKKKEPFTFGVVQTVNLRRKIVNVKLQNRITVSIRYDGDVVVGDNVVVGGDSPKFILEKVPNYLPEDTSLIVV